MNLKKQFSEEEIQSRIKVLAHRITKDYKDKTPIYAVCVLKGGFQFFTDLIKNIDLDIEVEFVFASSYNHSETPGQIGLDTSRIKSLKDKHVLVIDDIFDTGLTLESIKIELEYLNPASIKTCVLLRKHSDSEKSRPNYCCYGVPEQLFYIGYGMDYKGLHRNLPFILSKTKDD